MRRTAWIGGSSCLAALLLASGAIAQAPTTVQLPTFSFFTVQTTVSVPDRGGAYLGGISRAASGSASRGLPLASKIPGVGRLAGNRSLGTSLSGGGVSVHATIIDHDELDRAVLAEAAARRAARGETLVADDAALRAERLSRAVAAFPAPASAPQAASAAAAVAHSPLPSVEELRRRHQAEADARQAEARAYFAKAVALEQEGKAGVAKIYYRMAAARASDELKTQALARLAAR